MNGFENFGEESDLDFAIANAELGLGTGDEQYQPWEFNLDLEQREHQPAFEFDPSPEPLNFPTRDNFNFQTAGHINTSSHTTEVNTLLDWPFAPTNSAPPADDFLRFIEGAHRPPVACSYCRYNRLQCLIIKTTHANPNPVTSCSSCVALFRECSLAIGEKRRPSEFETHDPIVGHLHGVEERYEGLPGLDISNYASATDSATQVMPQASPTEPQQWVPKVAPAKGKRAISKQDILVLKAWLSEHRQSPYPSDEEKAKLRATTGLTLLQISNWFANARRRHKQIQSTPLPIPIQSLVPKPRAATINPSDLSPISRWKNSPPEDDPVDPLVVAHAIASSDTNYQLQWSDAAQHDSKQSQQKHMLFDAHSVSSRETSLSGSDSSNSAWSHGSWTSHHSFASLGRPQRRRYQKRNHLERSQDATYHCTFCPDSFKKRHDWQRHEKSIHLPLEHWICCAGNGTVTLTGDTTPRPQCIFCGLPNPSEAHLNGHEFNTCSDRLPEERTFRRKDHLRQHLVKFHKCAKPFGAVMELWKVEWTQIRSRCGFCDEWFRNWDARAAHLANHFKDGATMMEWAGDWGFGADILTLLQNAVVPSVQGLEHGGGVSVE